MGEKHRLQYRPEIDGLRAIAVIPVLLFHAGMGFPGGYVGVDVFFVISGYLIGTLILREAEQESFGYQRFWGRRLRRLFPAWAAVIVASTIAALFWLIPSHLSEFGESLIAQPLLGANFYFWRQSGYFETASEFQPLLHTWSLAVEEQFYVFLPLVLVPLVRFGRRFLGWLLLGFILVSLGLSIYQSTRYASFAFFLLPARIFELDLGVLLAWYLLQKREATRFASVLSAAGLGLIFLSYFLYDAATAFPGAAALMPCFGAVAFILGNSGNLTLSGRWVSQPFLVWVGKISYPLYLWHWPVLVFMRYLRLGELGPLWGASGLFLSFVLAWMTYRFIETPIRTRKVFPMQRKLTFVAVVFSIVVIGLGLVFRQTRGIPGRFSSELNAVLIEPEPSNDSLRVMPIGAWESDGGPEILGDQSADAPKLIVWGDSHAAALKPVVDLMGKKYGVRVISAFQPGMLPVPNTYPRRRREIGLNVSEKVEEYIEAEDVKNVLLVARWPYYVFGNGRGNIRLILQEEGNPTETVEEASEVFVRNLAANIERLETAGRKVWLMRSVGEHDRSVPETLAQIVSRGGSLNSLARPLSLHRKEDQPMNDLIDEAIEGSHVTVLDPLPLFTDESQIYLMARDGKPLYRDQNHLSEFGALELKALFEPVFREIAESKDR